MTTEHLKSIGPASAAPAEVGIETADDPRQTDAPTAHAVLRHRSGARADALFLFALASALKGQH